MLSVLVQIWGHAMGACNWVTTGIIENPETLDFEFLKGRGLDIIKGLDFVPYSNVMRLNVLRDGISEMKITMTDLW